MRRTKPCWIWLNPAVGRQNVNSYATCVMARGRSFLDGKYLAARLYDALNVWDPAKNQLLSRECITFLSIAGVGIAISDGPNGRDRVAPVVLVQVEFIIQTEEVRVNTMRANLNDLAQEKA